MKQLLVLVKAGDSSESPFSLDWYDFRYLSSGGMRITLQSVAIGAAAVALLAVGASTGVSAAQKVWNESEIVEALEINERKSQYGVTKRYFGHKRWP